MPSNSPVSFIHPGSPVLITGASHGLGRALALTLASRGARLMLVARGQPDLDAVVVEVRAARGEAHGIVADIEARLIAGHMALRGRGVVVHVSSAPARALAGAACSRPAPPSCGRSKAASPTAARCILAPGRPRCCSTPASCRGSSTVC